MKASKQPIKYAWEEVQDDLAGRHGAAIIIVDENSSVIHESNNSSMCRSLYSSEEFAPECDKFCGKAFQMAAAAGTSVNYRCYAGLDCRAVPVNNDGKTNFVAIVGRSFTAAENYRKAAERVISGDWKQFEPNEFFENVLTKGSVRDLETISKSIETLSDEEKTALAEFTRKKQSEDTKAEQQTDKLAELAGEFHNAAAQTATAFEENKQKNSREAEEFAAWRGLFGSL